MRSAILRTPTEFEGDRGGSIPSLPTLSPSLLLRPTVEPSFPIDVALGRPPAPAWWSRPRRAALYYLARNGVTHGLRALGVGPGDVVLMPAYHHGVEVEAVRAAGAGVEFYRVDRRLRADLDDVAERLAGNSRVRALYLTWFAGFPQPLDEALALCRERDLLLVEDCALGLFSRDPLGRPAGASGDLSIFCLYKTLPVPHGGLALTAADVLLPPGEPPPLWSTLHHLAGSLRAGAAMTGGAQHALWEAARSLARASVDANPSHERVGTMALDPAQLQLGASSIVPWLLARLDAAAVVARRRRNYARLLAALDGRQALIGPLPDGCCPLFFPLVVADKRAVHEALQAQGIDAIDFWSGGDPACDPARFPDAAWLRRHVLELPIHQDLDERAVDRVARAVKPLLPHA